MQATEITRHKIHRVNEQYCPAATAAFQTYQPSVLNATQVGSARQAASSSARVQDEAHGSCLMSSFSASVLEYFHQYTGGAAIAGPASIAAHAKNLNIAANHITGT